MKPALKKKEHALAWIFEMCNTHRFSILILWTGWVLLNNSINVVQLFQILHELNIPLSQNLFRILKKLICFLHISGSAFFQKSYLLLHQLAFHVGFLQGYETMVPWLDLASLSQLTLQFPIINLAQNQILYIKWQ